MRGENKDNEGHYDTLTRGEKRERERERALRLFAAAAEKIAVFPSFE